MEIVEIYPPFLYSIQYDGVYENEYDRLLQQWNNVEEILFFLEKHKRYLSKSFWQNIEPEVAAHQILDEATGLETLLDTWKESINLN